MTSTDPRRIPIPAGLGGMLRSEAERQEQRRDRWLRQENQLYRDEGDLIDRTISYLESVGSDLAAKWKRIRNRRDALDLASERIFEADGKLQKQIEAEHDVLNPAARND